jgi:hypothetical protein
MNNEYVEAFAVVGVIGFDFDAADQTARYEEVPDLLAITKVLWAEEEAEAEAERQNAEHGRRRMRNPALKPVRIVVLQTHVPVRPEWPERGQKGGVVWIRRTSDEWSESYLPRWAATWEPDADGGPAMVIQAVDGFETGASAIAWGRDRARQVFVDLDTGRFSAGDDSHPEIRTWPPDNWLDDTPSSA